MYDFNVKKKVVKAYLRGEGGYKKLSKKFNISESVAYEKGINENIVEISKSMIILNTLDDVDVFKEKLIELGVSLTDDEKNNFFEELDEYIEGASQ